MCTALSHSYFHARKQIFVEVITEINVFDFLVLHLPSLQLIIECHYFVLQQGELRQGVESIGFEFENVEQKIKLFGLLSEFQYFWLDCVLHLLSLPVSVISTAMILGLLVHRIRIKLLVTKGNPTKR